MRWGIIPSWTKELKGGYATFNARTDSITTQPAFRDAWKRGKRCLGLSEAGCDRGAPHQFQALPLRIARLRLWRRVPRMSARESGPGTKTMTVRDRQAVYGDWAVSAQ